MKRSNTSIVKSHKFSVRKALHVCLLEHFLEHMKEGEAVSDLPLLDLVPQVSELLEVQAARPVHLLKVQVKTADLLGTFTHSV